VGSQSQQSFPFPSGLTVAQGSLIFPPSFGRETRPSRSLFFFLSFPCSRSMYWGRGSLSRRSDQPHPPNPLFRRRRVRVFFLLSFPLPLQARWATLFPPRTGSIFFFFFFFNVFLLDDLKAGYSSFFAFFLLRAGTAERSSPPLFVADENVFSPSFPFEGADERSPLFLCTCVTGGSFSLPASRFFSG